MITIKLLAPGPLSGFLRQTSGGAGHWENCRFVADSDQQACDLCVLYGGIGKPISVCCNPDNIIFIATEPTNVWRYDNRFLAQFGEVWTSDQNTLHPNVVHTHPGLGWWVASAPLTNFGHGAADSLEWFENTWPIPKTKSLSVIASDKGSTAEHRKRTEFVRQLKEHFGDRIDAFGRGSHEISDKWEGIAPYRYHIALENCAHKDYWSEKIADTYLAGAFAIYWGCPNLADWFPERSFLPIDIQDPTLAIARIEELLADDPYDARSSDIAEARRRVLFEHNFFAIVARAANHRPTVNRRRITLWPERTFLKRPIRNRLKRTVRSIGDMLLDRTM